MRIRRLSLICLLALISFAGTRSAIAQRQHNDPSDGFGPIVRSYLGYLKNEQEVTDDRASRHEITRAYYIRNSNRIRALRQIAMRIARQTDNDYLPELEAAASDELGNLFEHPPTLSSLRAGEIYSGTFRFLGTVRSGDTFYVFARLDPYEQAELMEKEKVNSAQGVKAVASEQATSRPRRVGAAH